MALNPTALSALIKTNLLADPAVANNASLQKLCDAIAQAVVTHVTTSAVLITACPAGAGSGTVT